jgi:hypothetical protein
MSSYATHVVERRQALRNGLTKRPTTYKRRRPIVTYRSAPLYRKRKQANPMPHLYVWLERRLVRCVWNGIVRR